MEGNFNDGHHRNHRGIFGHRAAVAERFAQRGDTVVLMARRVDALNEVASRIAEAGGRAVVMPVDVTRKDDVSAAFREVYAEHSRIDRLVINAGIGDPTLAADFQADQFQRIIDVNLQGPAHCLEAVLPEMIERRAGQVIGIGSLAGYRGLPGLALIVRPKRVWLHFSNL